MVKEHFGNVTQLFTIYTLFLRINFKDRNVLFVVTLYFITRRMPIFTIIKMILQTDQISAELQTMLTNLDCINVMIFFRNWRLLPCLRQPSSKVYLVDQLLLGILQMLFEVVSVHTLVLVVFERDNLVLVHVGSLFGFVFVLRECLLVDFFVDVDFFD